MEWFKHLTASNDDPDISDALDEFGDAAITIFWFTLEIYGKEFNHLNGNGELFLSLRYFERKMRRKWKKMSEIFAFFQQRERIFIQNDGKTVVIKIPKFIRIASNWTKRQNSRPTEAPTEAPTAKEAEAEAEAELKASADAASSPKKHYKFKVQDLIDSIDDSCKKINLLPNKKTPFNPNKYVQKAVNEKNHPAAIDHTLKGMVELWDGINDPVAYFLSVVKSETPKFHAKDAEKKHKIDMNMWVELADKLKKI